MPRVGAVLVTFSKAAMGPSRAREKIAGKAQALIVATSEDYSVERVQIGHTYARQSAPPACLVAT